MAKPKQEPEVILDKIKQAVRGNRRLDLTFKDHRGQHWLLSMKKLETTDD
jgi:hypothetical protein